MLDRGSKTGGGERVIQFSDHPFTSSSSHHFVLSIRNPQSSMPVTGLEKFASLQDKIRLALEVCKTLKQDKERLEAELAQARESLADANTDNERLRSQVERLISERDSVRGNVEAMLHEIAKLEMEAESLSR